MSQPCLSKQVRDHQNNSEVFSSLFTEVIYIKHVKKRTQARARVTVQKKNRQSLINPNGFVSSDTYSGRRHIHWT